MGNITLTAILGHKVYITTHCYKLLGYGICNLFYVSDMPIKYIYFFKCNNEFSWSDLCAKDDREIAKI